MNPSTPGLPVHHQLPEFTQTHVHQVGDAIQPCHPLSSPSPPAPSASQHQGLFQWVNSSHEVAKVLEFQLQHQSFQWTPRTDLLPSFSWFLETAEKSSASFPLICKPTNPEFISSITSLSSSYSGLLATYLIQPRIWYQKTRESPYVSGPTEIIQTSQSQLFICWLTPSFP